MNLASQPAIYWVMLDERNVAQGFPAADGYRMPAEWVTHRRTWMCWPCRLEAWGSEQALARAKQATARVAREIASFEPVFLAVRPDDAAEARKQCGDAVDLFEVPLDDSWARDIGPSFLGGAGVVWQFNAWGRKYQRSSEDARFATRVLEREDIRAYCAPLVCEGGAVHVDGEGTLITTEQCLLNANRNPSLDREQVSELLRRYTGAGLVLWLPGTFADVETDGHVDNIACFAAPGRILLGVPSSRDHPDFEPVAALRSKLGEMRDARGGAIEIVEVAQPQALRTDWRGRPLAASYINFYLPNGGVVMPSFDDPADLPARSVLADCFPDREIVQLDACDLVQGGGGIHCITQQEPA